jgi:hypothetical protein
MQIWGNGKADDQVFLVRRSKCMQAREQFSMQIVCQEWVHEQSEGDLSFFKF